MIGLHTWSYDRFNQIKNMLPAAELYDFNLLLSEFRGNNLKTNPDCTKACGSEFAKQDIKDAIDYVLANYGNIDADNIFLLGCSGGGHMALLMAGFCPEYFNAINEKYPDSKVYLDIFDGKHQIIMESAMYWFNSQYKEIEITDVTG